MSHSAIQYPHKSMNLLADGIRVRECCISFYTENSRQTTGYGCMVNGRAGRRGDNVSEHIESHSEKQILEGCISLIQEMVDGFREYLDYIGHDEPEYEEEKQPFCMSYFHIVKRLFLWHTLHSGGTSTIAKCHELGIDDSSCNVKFYLWEDEEEE